MNGPEGAPVEVAVVGLGVRGLGMEGSRAFIQRLFRNPGPQAQGDARDLSLLAGLAADEAYAATGLWDPARSAIYLGLEQDPVAGDTDLLGLLTRRFGFQAQGRVCSAGELSGNRALATAIRWITAGVLDGVLVGAAAVRTRRAGDVPASAARGGLAVFLALRRKDDAVRHGDRIWAVLGSGPARPRRRLRMDPGELLPGRGSAVSGLLQVAAGCVMASHHVWYCREDRSWEPLLDRTDGVGFVMEVETSWGVGTCTDLWRDFRPGPPPMPLLPAPALRTYAGDTLEDLVQRVLQDERDGDGPVRLALVGGGEREWQESLARVPQLLQYGRVVPGWLDSRTCFSPQPVRGKVASLFTPVGSGYLGMGRELLLGMPALPMSMGPFVQDLAMADWIYQAHPEHRGDPLHECAATIFLSQAHAAFTRDILGLRPQVAMGLSMGEMNALVAYGAWGGGDGEFERMGRNGLYSRLLSGSFDPARSHWGLPEGEAVQWRNWTVFGPVDRVQERAAREERAYIAIVYSPIHCVLAGDAEACQRVLADCRGLTAVPALGLAAHTPVMAEARDAWRRLHHRPTRPVAGIEFHSSHFGGPFEPTPDRVAEALTGQILAPQDFPSVVGRAWAGGVRVFIEHGPRNLLTCAMRRLLPRDEGVFLALDVQGENSLLRAVKVAAELWCRGVPVDLGRLEAALGRARTPKAPPSPLLDVAASLFAASLARVDTMHGAYQACLRSTRGRFLEFMGLPPADGIDL